MLCPELQAIEPMLRLEPVCPAFYFILLPVVCASCAGHYTNIACCTAGVLRTAICALWWAFWIMTLPRLRLTREQDGSRFVLCYAALLKIYLYDIEVPQGDHIKELSQAVYLCDYRTGAAHEFVTLCFRHLF